MAEGVRIRPARSDESPIVRTLLGAHFLRPESKLWLAVQDAAPFIVGAASSQEWRRQSRPLRVRVIRPYRRRGIGSMLLGAVEQSASAAGCRTLIAVANSVDEPEAPGFLTARGYVYRSSIVTVCGGIEPGLRNIEPLEGRLRAAGRIPEDVRVVRIPDAPARAMVTLYKQELARHPMTTPWGLAESLSSSKWARCPAVVAGSRLAGFLLWDSEGDLARIPARIVAPEFQSGYTNVLLMADALREGAQAGMRRIEFEIPHGNLDTAKLARRLDAQTVRKNDEYGKKLA